jgi:aspartokinase
MTIKTIVLKFGGTSVGSSESIEKVIEIISKETRDKVVVLSAFLLCSSTCYD